MNARPALTLAALASLFVVVTACGGTGSGSSSGSSGNGTSGGTSGVFGGMSGGGVTGGSTSGGSTSHGAQGSSGGASTCDGTNQCPDCAACAMKGECAGVTGACEQNQECVAIVRCVDGCNADDACEKQCFEQHPEGKSEAGQFFACVVCTVCPSDCSGLAKGHCQAG